MSRALRFIAGWLLALVVVALRRTLRYRVVADSRASLRAEGKPYLMVLLHAQQVAAVCFNDEPRLCAMVSRSLDGDLLVPSLRARGVIPVRGSSMKEGRDKGGARALIAMSQLIAAGTPGLITVDGPRGPRGAPQPGAALLAQRVGVPLVPAMLVPRRRWILSGTWDRMQIPKPFTTVDVAFGAPLTTTPPADRDALCAAIGVALRDMEAEMDPAEGAAGSTPAATSRSRMAE